MLPTAHLIQTSICITYGLKLQQLLLPVIETGIFYGYWSSWYKHWVDLRMFTNKLQLDESVFFFDSCIFMWKRCPFLIYLFIYLALSLFFFFCKIVIYILFLSFFLSFFGRNPHFFYTDRGLLTATYLTSMSSCHQHRTDMRVPPCDCCHCLPQQR